VFCSTRHTSKETTTDTDPRPANGTTPHSDRHAAAQHPGRDIPSDQPSNHSPASIGATVSNRRTNSTRRTTSTTWASTSGFAATHDSVTRVTGVEWSPAPTDDYLRHIGPVLAARLQRRLTTDLETAWLAEFQRCMTRNLRGAGAYDTLDEVIGREMAKVHEHFDRINSRWTPALYARHRTRGAHAIVDLLRNDAAQRGEGARRTRTIASLDAALLAAFDGGDELSLYDVCGDDDPGYFTVETRELLAAALLGLSSRQREVVYLVDAIGHPVSDVAEQLGITRETASRALNAARRQLRVALDG
jgi:RNA polymerase sigma factor (sigma-70 family)